MSSCSDRRALLDARAKRLQTSCSKKQRKPLLHGNGPEWNTICEQKWASNDENVENVVTFLLKDEQLSTLKKQTEV